MAPPAAVWILCFQQPVGGALHRLSVVAEFPGPGRKPDEDLALFRQRAHRPFEVGGEVRVQP
jgi:hypothetical protein